MSVERSTGIAVGADGPNVSPTRITLYPDNLLTTDEVVIGCVRDLRRYQAAKRDQNSQKRRFHRHTPNEAFPCVEQFLDVFNKPAWHIPAYRSPNITEPIRQTVADTYVDNAYCAQDFRPNVAHEFHHLRRFRIPATHVGLECL